MSGRPSARTATGTLRIPVVGPFRLEAARAFLRGFTPAAGTVSEQPAAACGAFGGAASDGDRLVLTLRLDGSFAAVAAAVTEEAGAVVGTWSAIGDGEIVGERVARQVARVLSLDGDGAAYQRVLESVPPVARVAAELPGYRPVCFPSPYEAGLWGLLAQRVPMKRAAELRRAIAEQHGERVTLGSLSLPVVPSPRALLAVEKVAGLPDEKLRRLHALAAAAQAGALDVDRIRAASPTVAMERLSAIRGVGAWTAAHIVVRGAGTTDHLPVEEPRVAKAVEHAYGLDHTPDPDELARIAESWRPFRTWVAVLLTHHLGRTGDWAVPGARRGGSARRPRV